MPYYARRGVRAVLPLPSHFIKIFKQYLMDKPRGILCHSETMKIFRYCLDEYMGDSIGGNGYWGVYVCISDIIGERDKTLHKGT